MMKSLLTLLVACLSTLSGAQPAITQQEKQSQTTNRNSSVDSIVVCVARNYGWNMASNPVLRGPGTDSIRQVFCGAGQQYHTCFGYSNGYVIRTTTAPNGMGFWIKVVPPGPTICCIAGEEITQDTVPVATSWNIIGTISHPVPVSAVYSIPPGIIASGFFGFDAGYARVDTLRPGYAYWVKVSQPGQIVLSSGL